MTTGRINQIAVACHRHLLANRNRNRNGDAPPPPLASQSRPTVRGPRAPSPPPTCGRATMLQATQCFARQQFVVPTNADTATPVTETLFASVLARTNFQEHPVSAHRAATLAPTALSPRPTQRSTLSFPTAFVRRQHALVLRTCIDRTRAVAAQRPTGQAVLAMPSPRCERTSRATATRIGRLAFPRA